MGLYTTVRLKLNVDCWYSSFSVDFACPENSFKCHSDGKCIDNSSLCDAWKDEDCDDGSDEFDSVCRKPRDYRTIEDIVLHFSFNRNLSKRKLQNGDKNFENRR